MGCWNETCAVSKMTIYDGEPVRFLPIIQNAWHFSEQGGFPNGEKPILLEGSSGVYLADLWVPFCMPIRGKYNDYGSIDSVPEETATDKAELAQFIDAFKKNCIPLTLGENQYHDVPLKDFTLKEILEALQEGRVYSRYKGNQKDLILTVSWMMIKESVWQSLVELDVMKTDDASFYKLCLTNSDHKGEKREDTVTLNGIRELVKKYYNKSKARDELINKRSTIKSDNSEELAEYTKQLLAALGDFGDFGYRSIVWSHAPFQYQPEMNDALLDSYAEMEYVASIMGLLRINYAPTCGSGSQTSNHKTWKMAMTAWKKIAHKDEHRWDNE